MVEIHGHGSRRPARVQTDVARGNAQALVINGGYVGTQKLESNGRGQVSNFAGCRQVGIDKSLGRGPKGLEPADNGSCSFDRTKRRMGGGPLGDIIITGVLLLPREMNGDSVC